MPDAMPDNDINSFLSHDMKPIDEVRTGGMEIGLEIAHRVPAIGEEQNGLVLLHPLGFQQLP